MTGINLVKAYWNKICLLKKKNKDKYLKRLAKEQLYQKWLSRNYSW